MAYWIESDGVQLDAQVEIDGSDIRLFSRSGRTGTSSARNTEYSPGLRALLIQLRAANIRLEEAFVDSGRVQTLPLEQRRIFSPEDAIKSPDEQFALLSQRMRLVGRSSDKPGGNNNKLIRLCTSAGTETLRSALSLTPASVNVRSLNRIPDAEFSAITETHVWNAVQALRDLDTWLNMSGICGQGSRWLR